MKATRTHIKTGSRAEVGGSAGARALAPRFAVARELEPNINGLVAYDREQDTAYFQIAGRPGYVAVTP